MGFVFMGEERGCQLGAWLWFSGTDYDVLLKTADVGADRSTPRLRSIARCSSSRPMRRMSKRDRLSLQEIHAVEGHAGEGMKVPGDLEPGRAHGAGARARYDARGAALGGRGRAMKYAVTGRSATRATLRPRASATPTRDAYGEAAAALGTFEPARPSRAPYPRDAAQRSLCDRGLAAIDGEFKQTTPWSASSIRAASSGSSGARNFACEIESTTKLAPSQLSAAEMTCIQNHNARDDRIAREMACQRRVLCRDAECRGMPGRCVCSHGGARCGKGACESMNGSHNGHNRPSAFVFMRGGTGEMSR